MNYAEKQHAARIEIMIEDIDAMDAIQFQVKRYRLEDMKEAAEYLGLSTRGGRRAIAFRIQKYLNQE